MTKTVDAEAVIETIRESVLASKSRSRRILCKTLLTNFGFQRRTPDRMARLDALFKEHGIHVDPLPSEADREDWLHLTLESDWPIPDDTTPQPDLPIEWVNTIKSEVLESEREVEMHFVSPLFQKLGYTFDHEVAGFAFPMWQGVTKIRAEADIVYFDSTDHSIESGNPLILVECKSPSRDVFEGLGQAKSYAYWVKPAYYVITNGDRLVVYLYQGGAIKDVKVLEFARARLEEDFHELWSLLNYEAASEAKRQLQQKFAGTASSAEAGAAM